jgi:uncharacterized protein (TIGR02271 family)
MTKTVIALYDDFDTGRHAVEALVDAGFDRDDISIVANDVSGRYADNVKRLEDDGDVSSGEGAGFGAVVGGLVGLGVALIPGIGPVLAAGPLAAAVMAGVGAIAGAATGGVVAGLVDLGVPEEEAETYAESIRRGGALVSVSLDDEAHVARAEEILNRYSPVNIHERGDIYRQSGWSGYDVNAKPYSETELNQFRSSAAPVAPAPSRTINAGNQEKLEVVEEEVQVGKREVQDNTVRVHTRVTEKPVTTPVNLREEHVTVERHPVNRPASPADVTAFQEATIEMTEKHEEPVVSKTARVVEEVVVGKEASERTQNVNETVRRKDVVVEGATGTSAWTQYEPRFRTHYTTNYATSGDTWDTYSPAYQFGYELANDQRYTGWGWGRIESDAQYRWEQNHPSTWEKFKAAIRNAWDEVRGA